MPGFDRSGPRGAGPMTGGARGYCNFADTEDAQPLPAFRPGGLRGKMAHGRWFRQGSGRGRGFGRFGGRCFGPYRPENPLAPEEELNLLKQKADSVKATLDSINQRISELEK